MMMSKQFKIPGPGISPIEKKYRAFIVKAPIGSSNKAILKDDKHRIRYLATKVENGREKIIVYFKSARSSRDNMMRLFGEDFTLEPIDGQIHFNKDYCQHIIDSEDWVQYGQIV